MSLTKALPQANGYDASYWKIQSLQITLGRVINPLSTLYAQIAGYKDKLAYDDGSTPVHTFTVTVNESDFEDLVTEGVRDTTEALLSKMHAVVMERKPEFAGAVEDNTDLIS